MNLTDPQTYWGTADQWQWVVNQAHFSARYNLCRYVVRSCPHVITGDPGWLAHPVRT